MSSSAPHWTDWLDMIHTYEDMYLIPDEDDVEDRNEELNQFVEDDPENSFVRRSPRRKSKKSPVPVAKRKNRKPLPVEEPLPSTRDAATQCPTLSIVMGPDGQPMIQDIYEAPMPIKKKGQHQIHSVVAASSDQIQRFICTVLEKKEEQQSREEIKI